MDVCYGRPDEEEEVDEAFFRELEEASCLQSLVLMADLTIPLFAERATQQGESHPGGFWSSLTTSS